MSRDTDDESGTSSSEQEDEAQVESLISGRERRSTAGRWMGSLVAKAAADDAEQQEVERTLDEIFDEGVPEEDVDFEEDEKDDDGDLAISESDSDADAGQDGEDELEGEKQLQKAERAERMAKKRKAREAMVAPIARQKKIKTAPVAPTPESPAASKPRIPKKSERSSWLPTGADAPVRSSSRAQTMQNKATVHARMKESEQRRQKTVAHMEAAARKKAKNERPPKTQEQRLAEAAITERKNNKSLNRWQLAEEARQAEQRAKLEALRNKSLDGPVIGWYSGPGHWVNGSLKGTGKEFKIEEINEPETTEGASKENSTVETDTGTQSTAENATTATVAPVASDPGGQVNSLYPDPTAASHPSTSTTAPDSTSMPALSLPKLSEGIYGSATVPYQAPPPSTDPTPLQPIPPSTLNQIPPKPPPIVETAARSLIILKDFPQFEHITRAKERAAAASSILFGTTSLSHSSGPGRGRPRKDKAKELKPKEYKTKDAKPNQVICAVSDAHARYLDPVTNLPYSGLFAYKTLRRVMEGRCRWSAKLECFVGPEYELPFGKPAEGVPERFREQGGQRGEEKKVEVKTESVEGVEGS
ncbi:MAG: hypothetical protein M1820_001817 [Bogoriella megaspora]|nr:MAG: hypothetical protein M1820_001817 [Bogoriella megaspora]